MADLFNIGLSGLKASQTQLSVTGQNITNINTPGYTRQTALQSARDPSFTGSGYIGNGTSIVDVQRIHNQFLTNQVRSSTSMHSAVTAFQSQIEELNGLLSGTATGINPAMQSYFDALQTAVEDPASLPARQLFLAEADGLAGKFNTVHERLTSQNGFLAQQMGTVTDQVTRLASNIAAYNNSIATAAAQGAQPNDLLDARDEAIRELSQYVGVTVVPQDDNTVNLFVGTGQPLVVGNDASALVISPGRADPNRVEVRLRSGNSEQDVTSLVSGGELGGMLRYRGELDNALNSVGRLALAFVSETNQQLAQGLDLNGQAGAGLFAEINTIEQMEQRSVAIGEGTSGSLRISIDDTARLTTSDYEVSYSSSTEFTVRRLSDGKLVEPTAGTSPAQYDGFSIQTGNTPAQGDRFLLMPTRSGAASVDVQMKNPQDLAFAAPVAVSADLNNRGTGVVSLELQRGQALDVNDLKAGLPVVLERTATGYSLLDRNGNPVTQGGVEVTFAADTKKANVQVGGYNFALQLSGQPSTGDRYEVSFNSGTSDNRNALQLSSLQTDAVMGKSEINPKGFSLADGYGTLIQHVGTQTAQARAESEASGAVLKQAVNNRDSVSAVNLDEEAANLIKFEQYYNASAQVIQVARSMFDTLISSMR
ncbi:flagellar hook-associated protein 1 FlgK [Halopseudomonas xinjiangensis]|uniref:Flagellar hook-associated protein 1 n=1 Tax=Halopseudomonas xinjiangensis TaxID=487184 RepID=A0A1H1U3E8_9GAMM|nr:flagellar hook-associated protein FlgK [Halopseudomonas xinjiangensis]SDS67030.1 flagellar hook-associated protein 1 FlgK [Halopseudomonas xinjiangensis]